jgi:hypothetical protein
MKFGLLIYRKMISIADGDYTYGISASRQLRVERNTSAVSSFKPNARKAKVAGTQFVRPY